MSAPPPSPPARASARRARSWALLAVLLVASAVSAVAATILGDRAARSFDATSTGEHRLAPRTSRILARLPGPCELVVSWSSASDDPRELRAVRDVLDLFERASPLVRISVIDSASSAGAAAFDALVQRLVERESGAIGAQVATLREGIAFVQRAAAFLEALSSDLLAVRRTIPDDAPNAQTNRAYFEQRAAVARLGTGDLRAAAAQAADALAAESRQAAIPATDSARASLLTPLQALARELGALAENVERFAAAPSSPPSSRDAAAPLAARIVAMRDECAVIAERVASLSTLDVLRVARVLESSSATLVIGPPGTGLVAVDLDEHVRRRADAGDAPAFRPLDRRRRLEELFATAVGSIAMPHAPIVVLVHAEPAEFLSRSAVFDRLLESLALRRIDVVEWAAAASPEPPPLATRNPGNLRPVVYVSLCTDTAAGLAQPSGDASTPTGAERTRRLGTALAGLVERGESLLVSLGPSTLPAFGEPDPVAACLGAFGLTADTARPVLRERGAAGARVVETDQPVTLESRDHAAAPLHPIAEAIRGLPVLLTWPVPIARASADDEPRVWELLRTPADASWGESQWLGYWQTPREQRAAGPAPARDSTRDADPPPEGWLVAAAAERPAPASARAGAPPRQRLVVVGSNGWFVDAIARQQSVVDGRTARAFPGNAELFEAAVAWLAGLDDLVAASPEARGVPLIRPMDARTLALIRFAVVPGLPAAVILAGLLWRLVRG